MSAQRTDTPPRETMPLGLVEPLARRLAWECAVLDPRTGLANTYSLMLQREKRLEKKLAMAVYLDAYTAEGFPDDLYPMFGIAVIVNDEQITLALPKLLPKPNLYAPVKITGEGGDTHLYHLLFAWLRIGKELHDMQAKSRDVITRLLNKHTEQELLNSIPELKRTLTAPTSGLIHPILQPEYSMAGRSHRWWITLGCIRRALWQAQQL
jgi:hypothetical protein